MLCIICAVFDAFGMVESRKSYEQFKATRLATSALHAMASSAIFDAPELTAVFPYKLPRAESRPFTLLLPHIYSQALPKYLLTPMLTEAEQPKANTKSMSSKPTKARTTPSKRVQTKIFDWNPELAFVACLICFIAYLLSNGRGNNSGGNLYALCSGDRKIYTVDDNNSRAECIVVNGTSIIYVGDLGVFFHRFVFIEKLIGTIVR